MKDAKQRFTETAGDYDRYRPGYPEAVAAWLASVAGLAPGARVVDLGCGTGISTRLLAAGGFDVVGVDPNQAMLERARARGGGATYLQGEASATGLPAGEAALVVAFQAWHWFDLDAALAECARLLAPGGWAAAVWNMRGDSPFNAAWDELITRYSSEYRALTWTDATPERLRAHPRVRDFREAVFANAQTLDADGVRGRAYSSSYVVHGIDDHDGFGRELDTLFERFQQGGTVEMSYRTEAYAWRVGAG